MWCGAESPELQSYLHLKLYWALVFRVCHWGLLGNILACCACLCVCVCVCKAPIRGLSLELSRLSGYEEMKCTVRNVFPAPRVTWATEPPTFEDLRPVTRILADRQGLYTVDSRLKRLNGQPDLIYVCRVSASYGGPSWTSSLRERGKAGNIFLHLVVSF